MPKFENSSETFWRIFKQCEIGLSHSLIMYRRANAGRPDPYSAFESFPFLWPPHPHLSKNGRDKKIWQIADRKLYLYTQPFLNCAI